MQDIGEIILERSLPSHIREDYPIFVDFLRAYFEYLDIAKNPHDIVKHLRDYRNIDKTLDEFVIYFQSELLPKIPNEIAADKRLLAKHIKDLYSDKGNEASFRLFFRLMFGEAIEFYYPKIDILRASDGKWSEQKAIKVTFDNDVLVNIADRRIVGQTSNASAIVETAIAFEERGIQIIELTLSDIRGTFVANESISFTYTDTNNNTVTSTASTVYDVIASISITTAGSSYEPEDRFSIRSSDSTEIGLGTITNTTTGGLQSLGIVNGGTGYNGAIKNTTLFYAIPGNWTLDGDYLPSVSADGSASGDTVDYTQYTFDQTVTSQQIPGTPDRIQITDGPFSFGTGANGIVSEVDDDGVITAVELESVGTGYNLPSATVISETGTGAELSVVGGGGAVQKAILDSFPIILPSDYDSSGLTISADFSGEGDGNAVASLGTGTLENYPGTYLNEDGHLSSSKKLQDNSFYQDFSYVLKASRSISEWRDIVRNAIHPAGLAIFGEVNIVQEISRESTFESLITRLLQFTVEIPNNPSTILDTIISVDDVPIPEDSNGETEAYP